MELFLRGILPRVLPSGYTLDENCFIRPHQGKSDLKKSIPKKMRVYSKSPYPTKVMIIHDQDSNDCKKLKQELSELARASSSDDFPFLVRIACRELENWYLGDFDSLEKVYPEIKSKRQSMKKKFRNPDNVTGSHEIKMLTRQFSKAATARSMGPTIAIESNRSPSFQQFVLGLSKLLNEH